MSRTRPTVPAPPAIRPVVPPARGRPRKGEIDADAIRALAALGLNATTIAARLGLSRRTLFERLAEDPVARAAYDVGLADLVATAGAKLRELIEQGNVAAVIFTLKTKGGWLTPREASPALPDGGPVIDASVVYRGGEAQRVLRERHALALEHGLDQGDDND